MMMIFIYNPFQVKLIIIFSHNSVLFQRIILSLEENRFLMVNFRWIFLFIQAVKIPNICYSFVMRAIFTIRIVKNCALDLKLYADDYND